jgi:hypothetical protein
VKLSLKDELFALLAEYETTKDVVGLIKKYEKKIKDKFLLALEERLGG